MAPPAFAQMPATRRTPGVYTELNTTISNRGLVAKPIKVLFVGQMTAAGSATPGEIESAIESAADSWARFGRRSHLTHMLAAAFKVNPHLNASALAIVDDGAATAWEYQWTVTGPATADGEIVITGTGGLVVTVQVTSGDTDAQIATAIAAAITAADFPGLAYLVAVDGVTPAQVNFTAVNGGTVGSTLSIDVATDAAGVGGSGATTAGATDPDLQTDALDLLVSEDFDFIAVTLSDLTNLGSLRDHLAALIHPLVSLGSIGVFPFPGKNLGAATTLAANFATSGFMTGAFFPASASWEPELAGCYAGLLASQSDPALPYNNRQMTGLLNPIAAEKMSAADVETALLGGVCPIVVGAGNVPRIVRAISTYTKAPSGASDDALVDVTVARSLFYVRSQLTTMLQLKYPQAKNTEQRRTAIRADILAILFLMEQLEIVTDVEANADGVTTTTNLGDPSRVDNVIPAAIVPGLHLIVSRIDLTLPVAVA